MLRKITAVMAALAVSIMMAACGGEGDPGNAEQPAARAAPAAEAGTSAATQGQGGAPAPTRPQRLDLSPTEEPSGTGRAAETAPAGTPEGRPQGNQKTGQATAPTEAATEAAPSEAATTPGAAPKTLTGDMFPEDLIPEDPETSDEVLLQDIYALMDPDQPVPLPRDFENLGTLGGWRSGHGGDYDGDYGTTFFNYEEVKNHPYLHLFPGLKAHVEFFQKMEEEGKRLPFRREFQYHPRRHLGKQWHPRLSETEQHFRPMDGITHFIYHPWFEPVGKLDGITRYDGAKPLDTYQKIKEGDNWKFVTKPRWFGDNLTRGVIADAVARALEQAKKPGVEEHPVTSITTNRNTGQKEITYGDDFSLASTLRTPADSRRAPMTQWEFLHPRLPIIRVTNFDSRRLPLANTGEKPTRTLTTKFTVSFVISFQNRWASFEDPNRWLIRLEDELKEIDIKRVRRGNLSGGGEVTLITDGTNGGIHQELHVRMFPGYWHTSDYMQHRLIGPVVVQVYEDSRGETGVIEPGVYAVQPKVSHWEAPGPILKDEQVAVTPPGKVTSGMEKIEKSIVRPAPQGSYPNPGWPLPGHVMTNPATGPGTKIWKDARLDWYDW